MPKPPVSKPAPADPQPSSEMNAPAEPAISPIIVNNDARKFDQWLDQQLRGMFDAVAEEPVPQSLIDLIKGQGEKGS